MKLGVLTNLYGNLSLEDALKEFKALGIEAIELGAGGYPGKAHARQRFRSIRYFYRYT